MLFFHRCLQFWEKRKKSTKAKSGEYCGWGMITVLFLTKNSRTSIDVWADALSWCKIHDWFFHNSVRSNELLRSIGAQLQGSIPYWPYELVAKIHDVPRHSNRRKRWAKHLAEQRASPLTSSRHSLYRLYHNCTCVLLSPNATVNISYIVEHLIAFLTFFFFFLKNNLFIYLI